MKHTFTLSPGKITQVLIFVAVCLFLASLTGNFCTYYLGHDRLKGLIPLFDVDEENNIPTWYSAFILLLCSILLAVIAAAKKIDRAHYVAHWKFLAFIFLFLSMDEVICLHERTYPLRSVLKNTAGGFLYYPWVIFGTAFVLIVGLVYLKFLANLPAKTRYLFLIGGALYVGGAIGVEVFTGHYYELYGLGMLYAMLTTLEEFFEMLGIIVFIYALTLYISSYVKNLYLRIDDEKSGSSSL
ncbi:MAG: hypothetical protein AB1797_04760 [bacterium]